MVQLETERNTHKITLSLDAQTTYEEAIDATQEFTKQLMAPQVRLSEELNKKKEATEEPK